MSKIQRKLLEAMKEERIPRNYWVHIGAPLIYCLDVEDSYIWMSYVIYPVGQKS